MRVWIYAYECSNHRGQREHQIPLEVGSQVVLSCPIEWLGLELKPRSPRAVCTLNC